MTGAKAKKTLFVFMDESGDLQFGRKASQHFVLSAVCIREPSESAARMQKLKYELMAQGSRDLEFHATENSRGTRKRVLACISELTNLRVHTLWINKAFTIPSLQSEVALLKEFGTSMGRWVEQALRESSDEQVIMIFDSLLTAKQQKIFLKVVKPILGTLGVPYRVLFHPVKQDLNGQIADYFSWAAFRLLERNDGEAVRQLMATSNWDDFNLFEKERQTYWSRPN